MILRIIDKDTQLFKRDDFIFNEETEMGLNVQPAQGLQTVPKWDDVNEEWIESDVPWNEFNPNIQEEEEGDSEESPSP